MAWQICRRCSGHAGWRERLAPKHSPPHPSPHPPSHSPWPGLLWGWNRNRSHSSAFVIQQNLRETETETCERDRDSVCVCVHTCVCVCVCEGCCTLLYINIIIKHVIHYYNYLLHLWQVTLEYYHTVSVTWNRTMTDLTGDTIILPHCHMWHRPDRWHITCDTDLTGNTSHVTQTWQVTHHMWHRPDR